MPRVEAEQIDELGRFLSELGQEVMTGTVQEISGMSGGSSGARASGGRTGIAQ